MQICIAVTIYDPVLKCSPTKKCPETIFLFLRPSMKAQPWGSMWFAFRLAKIPKMENRELAFFEASNIVKAQIPKMENRELAVILPFLSFKYSKGKNSKKEKQLTCHHIVFIEASNIAKAQILKRENRELAITMPFLRLQI